MMTISTVQRNGSDYIRKEDLQRWILTMATNSNNAVIQEFAIEVSQKLDEMK